MELCKICHAGCCRRYKLNLWGSDIIRICEGLKVDMFSIISVLKVDKATAEELKDQEPLFIFSEAVPDMYFSIFLKKTYDNSKFYARTLDMEYEQSRHYANMSKCMFLQEWSAESQKSKELSGMIGRCGIYDIRPMSCRAYPAGYYKDIEGVSIRDPHLLLEQEDRKVKDSPALTLCPRPLEHKDYAIHEQGLFEATEINYYEKKYFVKVAQKWNKNPDVSDNFYEFLLKEYSNRVEIQFNC